MSDIETSAEEIIDSRGASCPGPLMDLIGAIRDAEAGTVILLRSDNEQSLTDVPEWAEETGNELLEVSEADDHYEFYVEAT